MAVSLNLPVAGTRRALVVIDAQPQTLMTDHAREQLRRIAGLVALGLYDAYVIATFSAPPGSMFDRQSHWQLSRDSAGPTDAEILGLVYEQERPVYEIHKTVRSIFKSDQIDGVQNFLRGNQIDELHIVGFDINDCVLATAYDALDLGWFSFVIEECSGRTDSDVAITNAALTVLRKQAMTNVSSCLTVKAVTIP